jgi:hypothetical protein
MTDIYDENRVDEWTRHMLHGWPYDETPLEDAMRAAARRAIHHAESEWRASHRPGSLTFTGMQAPFRHTPPVTRLLDATSTTDEIRATLEAMGVGERGILVALAAEILAADAATRYPMRWVAPAPAVLDDEPIPFMPVADEPVGERVRWPLDEGDTGEALLHPVFRR